MNRGFIVSKKQICQLLFPNSVDKLDRLEALLEMQIIHPDSRDGNEAKEANLCSSKPLIKSLPIDIHIPKVRDQRQHHPSDVLEDKAKVAVISKPISCDESEKDQIAN